MQTSNEPTAEYFIPTAEWIDSLKVGDMVPDGFGKLARITRITARDNDVNGDRFVCLYTEFGANATISGSFKAGELHRTLGLCSKHTSAELDKIEKTAKSA